MNELKLMLKFKLKLRYTSCYSIPLPVNIPDIIEGRVIENERLEYKENWNPEKVLHTICAFANDYEKCGGGYVIIGIKDVDGRLGEVVGLQEAEIPKIEKELFNLCNLIEPRYVPTFSDEVYEKKHIIIGAASNRSRPYKCPVSISVKKARVIREGILYSSHVAHCSC